MKKINNLISQLENINSKADQEIIKNCIAKLFKEMGYTAISEEIKNNRKAKSNALYGLNSYYKSAASDRYNMNGEVVYKHTPEYMNKLNAFKESMTKLINQFLDDGNDKQQYYLELMDRYSDAYYQLATIGEKLDQLEIRKNRKEWEKLYQEYKDQSIIVDELKNKLDKFVMDHLAG